MLKFTLDSKDPGSGARAGILSTDHGDSNTHLYACWYGWYRGASNGTEGSH